MWVGLAERACAREEWRVGLGWVRASSDGCTHGWCPYLRDTTGLAHSQFSGCEGCQTVDRPHTPQWHSREGDAAMPVCMACTP